MMLFLALTFAISQQDDPQITQLITPQHALTFALEDLATIPNAEDRRFQRYLWIPPWGDAAWIPSVNFAVNTACSHSRSIQYPTIAAGGWMLRYDLRALAPEADDLQNLIDVWDGLSLDDPYFHIPTRFSGTSEPVAAPHLSPALVAAVNDFNQSSSLVYRADWFVCMSLDTVDGGRYYDFRRFRDFPRRRVSDGRPARNGSEEAAVLAQFGIFEDLSQQLKGDRRVGMFVSGVTGKPRAVSFLRGSAGEVWVTEDPVEDENQADRHPMYSLLDQNFRGREIIFTLNNGLHGFLITNEEGDILDSVPDTIATDSLIPSPHVSRLQGAISCIRCHAVSESVGLRDVRNDVSRLLSSGLQVIGDVSEPDSFAARDDIAGLYGGRFFDRHLERGRFDYSGVIEDEITRGQMTATELFDKVTEIYNGYRYPLIDLQAAMQEVGFDTNSDAFEAVAALRSRLRLEPETLPGLVFDDPTIAGLAIGIQITRKDFERVYNDFALRVQPTGESQ